MTESGPDGCVEVHLRGLDTRVVVELRGSGAAELEPLVRRAWASCLVDDGSEPEAVVPVTFEAGADPVPVLDRLSPQVTVAAIDARAGELVMLHAAGLADPATGRTVGLVAPSGTGKTTACRTLAGSRGYVTDETLGIRPDGSIAAYRKPLSVRDGDAPFKDQVPVDELATPPDRCELAGLAILARDDSAEPWVETMSTVRALAALAPESSYLARVPDPLHRLASLVEGVGGLKVLHYREAADLEPLIDEMLAVPS